MKSPSSESKQDQPWWVGYPLFQFLIRQERVTNLKNIFYGHAIRTFRTKEDVINAIEEQQQLFINTYPSGKYLQYVAVVNSRLELIVDGIPKVEIAAWGDKLNIPDEDRSPSLLN